MSHLTNIEKETTILCNEAEQTAEIFTYRSSLIRQLDALVRTRPDDAVRVKKTAEGGVTYSIKDQRAG